MLGTHLVHNLGNLLAHQKAAQKVVLTVGPKETVMVDTLAVQLAVAKVVQRDRASERWKDHSSVGHSASQLAEWVLK
jgi:hypothetical protein